jgi:hypothetical protein
VKDLEVTWRRYSEEGSPQALRHENLSREYGTGPEY